MVIPQALVDKEIAHAGLSDLRVVDSMHERKALMADLSDAFIALPGGLGTLDELFEVWTWAQLGMHRPCALLDVNGYFASLTAFLEHSVAERFVREQNRAMLLTDEDPKRLIARLRDFDPEAMQPKVDRPRGDLCLGELWPGDLVFDAGNLGADGRSALRRSWSSATTSPTASRSWARRSRATTWGASCSWSVSSRVPCSSWPT